MRGREEAPHSNRRDFANLKKLSTYLWEYRGRVLLALGCLMLSKLAIVAVPLLLKKIINTLDAGSSDPAGEAVSQVSESAGILGNQDVLLVALGFVAAYGLLRLCSSLFKELRDALFARVRYRAMHQLSTHLLIFSSYILFFLQ